MSAQEKRRYFRLDFKRQVQLDFYTEFYDECSMRNISLGGMFINGNFPHKEHDQCSVTISQTTKATSLTFKALAKIVRRQDDGIALEFVSMSFESLVSLELILLYEPRDEASETDTTLPTELPFAICEDETPIHE